MVIEVNWGLTEIKSNGNFSAKHNLNLRIGVRQEKAKMCGDEGRFDFFQEKQNSQIFYAIHTHGSRKNRYFTVRLAVRGGGSAPLALTVSNCEIFSPTEKGLNSVFRPKTTCFFTHQIHEKLTIRGDWGGGATLTASLTVKYLLFLQLPVANVSNYTFFGVICLPQKLRSHIFWLKNIKSDFGGLVTFSIHYISVVGFNTEHKVC